MKTPALLLAAAVVLAACGEKPAVQEPVRPVITQRVVPGAAASRDVYSGEMRARYETELGFRVGGKLVSRAVDAGARVTRGQVLARLDPEDAKLAAQGSAAQLASAESGYTLAKSELERYADLLSKKFISQSAFDAKQNAFSAAKARADLARVHVAARGGTRLHALRHHRAHRILGGGLLSARGEHRGRGKEQGERSHAFFPFTDFRRGFASMFASGAMVPDHRA